MLDIKVTTMNCIQSRKTSNDASGIIICKSVLSLVRRPRIDSSIDFKGVLCSSYQNARKLWLTDNIESVTRMATAVTQSILIIPFAYLSHVSWVSNIYYVISTTTLH